VCLLAAAILLPLAGFTAAHAQPVRVHYGDSGLEVGRTDGPFHVTLGGRVQLRYATPFVDDPLDPEELGRERQTLTNIRRARGRADGHLFTPRLSFAFQYDIVNSWLLDASANYEVRPWLQVRAGQWKPDYNRERIASSAEQALVERSVVTQVFTIPRQQGLMVHGRAGEGRRVDSTFRMSVFAGGGRSTGNEERRPLWVARYQWNALGGGLDAEAVDLRRSRTVRMILAVAASSNQTVSAPVGREPDDEPGDLGLGADNRFRRSQWVGEAALQWRGIAMQHEYHWKQSTGRTSAAALQVHGLYAQVGCFPHEFWRRAPRPLELTARLARVGPDVTSVDEWRRDRALGANWYLRGFASRVSADLSWLQIGPPVGASESGTRVRVQWDVSF
jgi:phosphate-selective porin OprO and OprP